MDFDEHQFRDISKIDHLNYLDTSAKLLFDLLKRPVVTGQADGYAGHGYIFRSADFEAVQIIGFAGKQAADAGKYADIIFYQQQCGLYKKFEISYLNLSYSYTCLHNAFIESTAF